jgi:hypothetical protein
VHVDSLSDLTELNIPDYAFGVEMPVCAALHVYSVEGLCYAGGFDASPLPGPGGLLCESGADTMTILQRLNVTAVTEWIPQSPIIYPQEPVAGIPVPLPPVSTSLLVGTTDDGIHEYQPLDILQKHVSAAGAPAGWTSYPAPNGEPVADILAVSTFVPELPAVYDGDLLYVAVASGVYRKCRLDENCVWQEIGDLPAYPLCLAAGAGDLLYAGTSQGAYEFSVLTRALPPLREAGPAAAAVAGAMLDKSFTLSFPSLRGETVSVRVYDASGKQRRFAQTESASVSLAGLSRGIYTYRVGRGNETVYSGRVVVP